VTQLDAIGGLGKGKHAGTVIHTASMACGR
jgi:hypothetical protein